MLSSCLSAKLSSDNFQIKSQLENKITHHVFKTGTGMAHRRREPWLAGEHSRGAEPSGMLQAWAAFPTRSNERERQGERPLTSEKDSQSVKA